MSSSVLGTAGRTPLPCSIPQVARGMTLLEVMIATAMFALLMAATWGALRSAINFTQTGTTQVDLQEEAQRGLGKMVQMLELAGNFTAGNTYPAVYFSNPGTVPTGFNAQNNHPPPSPPKSQWYNYYTYNPVTKTYANGIDPGRYACGGDPTLASSEVIFKIPQNADYSLIPGYATTGLPTVEVGNPTPYGGAPTMSGFSVQWTNEEYGFFVVPVREDGLTVAGPTESDPTQPSPPYDPNVTNVVEFRNSLMPAEQVGQHIKGQIVARYVDRLHIMQQTNAVDASLQDPTLSKRQLRIELYLTRRLDPPNPNPNIDKLSRNPQMITIMLSTVVDMRNDQLQ